MKNFILCMISAVCITACSTKDGKLNPVNYFSTDHKRPSQNFVDKQYVINFNSIQVSAGIEAEVIKGNEEKVVITAPDNFIDEVLVDNENGNLHLHFKPGLRINGSHHVRAKIYAKDFNAIKANSSGSIEVKDKFVQEKMSIHTSSSGSVEGDFEANDMSIHASSSGEFSGRIWAINLNTDVSSSGEVDLKGTAKQTIMQASSSGSVNAAELVTETANLQASSSGDIDVAVSRQLMASASSSGGITVYRKGDVAVTKTESSSGTVTLR